VGFWAPRPGSEPVRRSAGVAKMVEGPTPAIPQVPDFLAGYPAGDFAVVDALVAQHGPTPAAHPGVEKVHEASAYGSAGQTQGSGLEVAENPIRASHGLGFPSFWVEQGLC
jgi:hypothetical protein